MWGGRWSCWSGCSAVGSCPPRSCRRCRGSCRASSAAPSARSMSSSMTPWTSLEALRSGPMLQPRPRWPRLPPAKATPTRAWWSCPRRRRGWASTSWGAGSRTPPFTSPASSRGAWPTGTGGSRGEINC